MIKKELRALRTLKATPKILELAVADTKAARTYQSSWGICRYTGYQYNIFLRCQTLKGYLKVAMFLPKLLREGKDLPVYELFISKKAGQYLTWDCRKEQWREAMADNLPWIEDLGWNWRQGTVWINPEGKQTIQKYLGTQKSGWEGILEWQRKTKRENLEAMYKRETDRWDADLKLTPALPRGWTAWLGKEAVEEHYIFYEYKRSGAKEGYCTHCEKTVPIQEAGHNKKTVCSCCGAAVTMKSMGKQKYLHTKPYYAYLIQRTKTGLEVREFWTKNAYRKDGEWKKNTYSSEIRRAFFDREVKMSKAYRWDLYRNREHRFVATGNCCQSWGGCQPGKVYPGTIPGLAKQELKKTGFPEYWKENPRLDAEWYLAIYNYHPVIEQLVKAGLPRLVKDCLEYISRFDQVEKIYAGELTKKNGPESTGAKAAPGAKWRHPNAELASAGKQKRRCLLR